jgi:hypothetical protein
MSTKQNHKDAGHSAHVPQKPDAKQEIKNAKAHDDQLLTEALEESFPGSDPLSSMRFTETKKE